MKILWFDTETTGLSPRMNDIISLACLVEIDGEVKDKLYLEIQPTNWQTIQPKALEVNGYTVEQLKTFLPPAEAHRKLNAFLGKHCDKFNRGDKFIPAGHNVIKFDVPFLDEFYKKLNDKYLYSWLDYHVLDTMPLALTLKVFKKLPVENVKLVTLAQHYGIEFKAHNSLSDIETTRDVFYKMAGQLLTK